MFLRALVFTGLTLFATLAAAKPRFQLLDSNGQKVTLYDSITDENVSELFSGKLLMPGEFGANAIAVQFAGQKPEVYFFAIGEDRNRHDIIHPDVLLDLYKRHIEQLENKTHAPELPRVIEAAQGFELQAKIIDGHWEIIGMEIDSIITQTQLRKPGMALSAPVQSLLVSSTIERIAPNLVRFDRPAWPAHMPWTWCGAALE